MGNKTFKVEALREKVNAMLLNSADGFTAERRGMMQVLESVLHDTDNYNGFGYLDTNEMKQSDQGTTVGINGYVEETKQWDFEGTDSTRVRYY